MKKILDYIGLSADTLSIISFLFWIITFPNLGSTIVKAVTSFPLTLRFLIVVIFELSIAYSLSAFIARFLKGQRGPLGSQTLKLTIVIGVCFLVVYISISNLSTILFLNNFFPWWKFMLLFILKIFFLWLKGYLLRSQSNEISLSRDIPLIQKIYGSSTLIIFAIFVIERALL